MATPVIAVDPGLTTGLAMRLPDGRIETLAIKPDNGELPTGFHEVWDFVRPPFVTLVIERFATAGRLSHYGLITIELVGSMKALAWSKGMSVFVHNPGQRRPWQDIAEKYLVATGRRFVVHEADALAHLLAHEKHKRGDPVVRQ